MTKGCKSLRRSAAPGSIRGSDKLWRDAILRAVKKKHPNGAYLDRLARALVMAGIRGDVQALREVGDRIDGRPTQQVVATGADGGAMEMKVIVEFVGAKK